MTSPIQAELALTEAEKTCFKKMVEILGLHGDGIDAFIGTNGGKVECIVFDIGYPQTGETQGFVAKNFHFRGKVDLYSRNRETIQRWIMRTLLSMPIGPTQSASNELDVDTTVQRFRIAPETRAVTEITTTELKNAPNVAGVNVFTASIDFDIVFTIGTRGVPTA